MAQQVFVHWDGRRSIRTLTNESGTVTDKYSETAFGQPLLHSGVDSQPYRFCGEPLEASTGLFYNRARWLSPPIFISEDPMSRLSRIHADHPYLYANADPINQSDPTGQYASMEGNLVHEAIQNMYGEDHPGQFFMFGKWSRGIIANLKPDILNFSQMSLAEIKPLSLSGIYDGFQAMTLYQLSLETLFRPDRWVPSKPAITPTGVYFVVNVDGILFYTNVRKQFDRLKEMKRSEVGERELKQVLRSNMTSDLVAIGGFFSIHQLLSLKAFESTRAFVHEAVAGALASMGFVF
jgi:RHS repeat-associated protein